MKVGGVKIGAYHLSVSEEIRGVDAPRAKARYVNAHPEPEKFLADGQLSFENRQLAWRTAKHSDGSIFSKEVRMGQKRLGIEAWNALNLETYVRRLFSGIPLEHSAGDPSAAYHISIESTNTISEADLNACFDLLTTTSKANYKASSIGWHPRAKKREMKLPDLRYLLVRSESADDILGFASFMLTYEDGYEVIYLYEIHLLNTLRGRGLGKKLVDIIQNVGENADVEKMMLTVYLSNEYAIEWYNRLGFQVDDFSPGPRKLRSGVVKWSDYHILSKPLKSRANAKK